ncbi:hypothetical protein CDAR_524111 [Caerostris darwini]|uniref:C2H2-type domain-containing protein n=1 Tax=Caerostris darwini TaxID=1538125 RepID=A0AAV4WU26_9ARAC|nr:hypothetical protein CDAR_524111 [Caerostris darwini]
MCSVCNYTTDRSNNLKKHFLIHTGQPNLKTNTRMRGSKIHVCSECSYATVRKADLWKHMVVHSGFRPFQCQMCLKSFKRKDHLELHLRTHYQ